MMLNKHKIFIVGVSTGGPPALKRLFKGMPRLDACILLVLHMPKYINDRVRTTLAMNTDMDVVIPSDGERLEAGTLYIAPSELHMVFQHSPHQFLVPTILQLLNPDAVGICFQLESSRLIQYISFTTTHSGSEVLAGLTQYHHDTTRHIFAPMISDPIDDAITSRIPDGKPFSCQTV